MIRPTKLLIPLTALLVTACANDRPDRPDRSDNTEHFVTNILEDGSKMFNYDITMQGPKKRRQPGRGKQDREAMIAKMEKRFSDQVYKKLETQLKETAYCRQGYVEIDSNIGRGHGQISGQCNEPANEADSLGFPNTNS